MREDDTPGGDSSLASLAGGGAAVGAGFGGLIGAVVGWIMGAQVTAVPQIGPVVGQWVLPSTLVGLLAGAVIGALIGALAAIASVGQRPSRARTRVVESEPAEAQESLVETSSVEPEEVAQPAAPEPPAIEAPAAPLQPRSIAAATPTQPQAQLVAVPRRRPKIRPIKLAGEPTEVAAPVEGDNDGPLHASISSGEAPVQEAQTETEAAMDRSDRSDEQLGRNPNTFTGTEDAVDPDTGALGTAGTPVTTGYGVSGSTVGVGTRRRRKREESSDFRGATPDSASYDTGGRAATEKGALRGAEREPSVAERNSDAGRVEASVPRGTEGRDIYEQSEGYVENLERDPGPPPATNVAPGVNESAGTDIPGTEDPRGLGDNTDEPL